MTSSILCSWHAADPYRHPLCDTGMLQFCISHEEAHSLHCPDDKRQRHIVTSQSQSVRSLNKRTLFCAGEADVGSDFSLLRQICAPDSFSVYINWCLHYLSFSPTIFFFCSLCDKKPFVYLVQHKISSQVNAIRNLSRNALACSGGYSSPGSSFS